MILFVISIALISAAGIILHQWRKYNTKLIKKYEELGFSISYTGAI